MLIPVFALIVPTLTATVGLNLVLPFILTLFQFAVSCVFVGGAGRTDSKIIFIVHE